MAKENKGTNKADASLVIALGPGFAAGKDAHRVVETNPASSHLGRVLSEGQAEANTDIPDSILGLTEERIIRSPANGVLFSARNIGDKAETNDVIGFVKDSKVVAPLTGVIWGLVREGLRVKKGQKIGDIDPRGDKKLCFQITLHARAIAEGVLKSIIQP
jgi:xanthine dehydrogenase accessory factor